MTPGSTTCGAATSPTCARAWSSKPENYDFEAPKEGTPINSDAYVHPDQRQAPRHRDALHRLPAPAGEREEEHGLPLLPVPGEGRRAAFAKLVKDAPACNVDVKDLENPDVFRLLGPDEVQRRAATWTEVKAS